MTDYGNWGPELSSDPFKVLHRGGGRAATISCFTCFPLPFQQHGLLRDCGKELGSSDPKRLLTQLMAVNTCWFHYNSAHLSGSSHAWLGGDSDSITGFNWHSSWAHWPFVIHLWTWKWVKAPKVGQVKHLPQPTEKALLVDSQSCWQLPTLILPKADTSEGLFSPHTLSCPPSLTYLHKGLLWH